MKEAKIQIVRENVAQMVETVILLSENANSFFHHFGVMPNSFQCS